MCGRHYRCCPELLARKKLVERRGRQVLRHLNALWTAGAISAVKADARFQPIGRLQDRAWEAMRVEAQRQQDAGFFARSPRRKAGEEVSARNPLADRFEDQFQRLKRGQNG